MERQPYVKLRNTLNNRKNLFFLKYNHNLKIIPWTFNIHVLIKLSTIVLCRALPCQHEQRVQSHIIYRTLQQQPFAYLNIYFLMDSVSFWNISGICKNLCTSSESSMRLNNCVITNQIRMKRYDVGLVCFYEICMYMNPKRVC